MSKAAPVAKPKKPVASKVAGVTKRTLDELVEVFKSLADPSRLQIILLLAREEQLHVSAICDAIGQTQPAVSHHLTQLKHAGLVDFDRTGKYNYYRLDSTRLSEILEAFFPDVMSLQQRVAYGELEMTFKAK